MEMLLSIPFKRDGVFFAAIMVLLQLGTKTWPHSAFQCGPARHYSRMVDSEVIQLGIVRISTGKSANVNLSKL
jgi:hypothetical protein